jgi:hypothetical protein
MQSRQDLMSSMSRGFEVCLNVDRSYEIDEEQKGRCLTRVGASLFIDAVTGYLLLRKEKADALRDKARSFLQLAYDTQEKPRHDYTPNYDEAMRATALSYVDWLATGRVNDEVLAEAGERLKRYYLRTRTLDRTTANLATPTLLYTRSFSLIVQIAERKSWKPIAEDGKKNTGLFFSALRVALATDDTERQKLIGSLRKNLSKRLLTWIQNGLYDDLAYALYAHFPKPEGEPSKLIEEAWQYIPDEKVQKPNPEDQ